MLGTNKITEIPNNRVEEVKILLKNYNLLTLYGKLKKYQHWLVLLYLHAVQKYFTITDNYLVCERFLETLLWTVLSLWNSIQYAMLTL